VEPRDLGRVCVGQSATLTTEAFPNLSLNAKVGGLGPALRPRTTITAGLQPGVTEIEPVILGFEDGGAKLPIGITVTAHFAPCPSRS
jgi:hypothetical protein